MARLVKLTYLLVVILIRTEHHKVSKELFLEKLFAAKICTSFTSRGCHGALSILSRSADVVTTDEVLHRT